MAKRGPGKFNSDLDAAIYSLSLDGTADEEASYEGGGSYLLFRDGAELADAIEDRRKFAPEEVEGVDAKELKFLSTEGKAGVIVFERSDGIVEVSYYTSKADLDKDWAEVEAETSGSEDEEFEANGEEDILRDETIEPFLKGKDPVFRIQTWETGKYDKGIRSYSPMLGYRLSMKEPKGKWEVLFEGEDYSPGASKSDSDQTLNDILAFFTNDYEDDTRTARQREVVKQYGDYLSGFFDPEEREENPRRKNGQPTRARRRNGEEDILREERFEPYVEGKGPVFDLEMWYAGRGRLQGTKRVDSDRDFTGYRLTMTEPGKRPVVLFEGEDLSLPAGTDAAGDRALEDLMGFLTLKPGDTDDEYFEKYTPEQHRFAEKHAESLSVAVEDLLHPEERAENPRRKNGQARFRVYLNGELSDTAYYDEDMSEAEVRRSLIDHDGFDPRITVKKVEPRRTGIPAERYVENRKWSRGHVNDLPDSAFLYIEPGGHKDPDHRTVPRSLRHFPYKTETGAIDLAHLRNALSRIPQSSLPADVKRRARDKAEALLASHGGYRRQA